MNTSLSATPLWRKYELAAAEILGRLHKELGLSSVEGKQKLEGASGTEWEVDAKGIAQDSGAIVLIECKRFPKSKVEQDLIASLAFRIKDLGAAGGIVVSPLGLQEGARRVATSTNVRSIRLNVDATPEQFALWIGNDLFAGLRGQQMSAQTGILTAVVENNVVPPDSENAG
jgi:hypothetical protein